MKHINLYMEEKTMRDKEEKLEKLQEELRKSLGKKIGLTLPYAIQASINAMCKGIVKKNDTIILTTFIDGQFRVWIYPYKADLEVVQNLLITCLTQVKNTYMTKKTLGEKEKAKRLQKQYIG